MGNGAGTPPIEYINYLLMRHVLHCTPSQLRREDARDIATLLDVIAVESEVQEIKGAIKKLGQK